MYCDCESKNERRLANSEEYNYSDTELKSDENGGIDVVDVVKIAAGVDLTDSDANENDKANEGLQPLTLEENYFIREATIEEVDSEIQRFEFTFKDN